MNAIISKLNYAKDNEYVVNSKFFIVVHLPFTSYYDFDLVFFGENGSIVYKNHIQNKIKSIKIDDKLKTCYIEWKE